MQQNFDKMYDDEIIANFNFVSSNPTINDWEKQINELMKAISEVENFVKKNGKSDLLETRLDFLYGYKVFFRNALQESYNKVVFSKSDMQKAAKLLAVIKKK